MRILRKEVEKRASDIVRRRHINRVAKIDLRPRMQGKTRQKPEAFVPCVR